MSSQELILLGLVWLLYFVLHSLLASLQLKGWVASNRPQMMPWYRLFYNLVATITLLPPLYLVFTAGGDPVWAWQGYGFLLANGLSLLAVFGFLYTLRYYDGAEFLGLRQLREQERRVEDQETLQLSPLHYHVRHPWYFLGLVLIWTRDMPPAMLMSAILATLYFIIGAYLEERKLVVYYGEVYRQYQRRVPALIPLPWRHLDSESARHLLQQVPHD